jgi:hypothetical protein
VCPEADAKTVERERNFYVNNHWEKDEKDFKFQAEDTRVCAGGESELKWI